MKKRRIIQPILWTEQPTGAVMGARSLWPRRQGARSWALPFGARLDQGTESYLANI